VAKYKTSKAGRFVGTHCRAWEAGEDSMAIIVTFFDEKQNSRLKKQQPGDTLGIRLSGFCCLFGRV